MNIKEFSGKIGLPLVASSKEKTFLFYDNNNFVVVLKQQDELFVIKFEDNYEYSKSKNKDKLSFEQLLDGLIAGWPEVKNFTQMPIGYNEYCKYANILGY